MGIDGSVSKQWEQEVVVLAGRVNVEGFPGPLSRGAIEE